MDKKTLKIFFALLRSAVCGTAIIKEERDNYVSELLPELKLIAKNHDIEYLLALGIKNTLPVNDTANNIENQLFKAVYRYEQLNYELINLCEILENTAISFIPLKGAIIRNYYPEPWMRTSCDIDILVKNMDLDKTVNMLVEKYGYTFKERGLHDISLYSKNKIHIELHFDLTSEERYTKILSSVWDNCVLADNKLYEYIMNREFFTFYHITHMAEHFIHGGCGIRPFIDLWVIKQKIGYDERIVVKMCEEVGLSEFYIQIINLMNVWLENDKHTSLTSQMEDFIIGAGIYGTMENNIALNRSNDKGKFKYILSRIFLPYEKLKRLYPKVEQYKILTPLYQVRRWINFVFKKDKKRVRQELKVSSSISREKISSVKYLCKTLGLK